MYKDISPDDKSIKEFKTYKSFTFTHTDSGSGVLDTIPFLILNHKLLDFQYIVVEIGVENIHTIEKIGVQ